MANNWLGPGHSRARHDFPHRLFGGRKLRFPPSNVRSAHCLPFADFVLRPRGPSPLDPPRLGFANARNLARFGPSLSPPLRFGEPCPFGPSYGPLRDSGPRSAHNPIYFDIRAVIAYIGF